MARSSQMSSVTSPVPAAALQELASSLGLDAVGAAAASAYADTERHIAERRERGLFGWLRFTMARPERSCHPERVLPGVRSVVAAARCYWADAPEPGPGEGRMPRYAWDDAYRDLRLRLERLGELLGGEHRVLVDENDHVDREAAVRAGVGFYGKNTMVITRAHGSWVVLGTILTTAEIEPSEPLRAGCGSCTLCIDACPTDAIVEPGVLDATRCLSTWTQTAGPIPEDAMTALGDRVYGCDICQDVCPWNRGVERRRAEIALPDGTAGGVARRVARAGGHPAARARRRAALRPAQRSPLAASERAGRTRERRRGRRSAPLAVPWAEGDDAMLRAVAERALARIAERTR